MKIYKTLGVDPQKVFSDLHVAASGAEPVSKTKPNEAAGFALDADRIAKLQRESERVSILLAGIFKEEDVEVPDNPPEELAVEEADNTPRLLGLDEPHATLARMLLSRPQWEREDLLDVASDLDLMLDGALERINEVSFDLYDIAFTEGESPITINQEIFEKIEQ
ncbi:MAG TPA: tellurite resistance TerB C-terminal domain-containing protein [Ferrovaceae bacterium]|nr:tellurite resistance TerB C-terminal domain-containing protein [Ferrovaceae bacterium]HQU07133.1 tellurite resistance TerB C-terminal domain-containing protein [Ferrovaceae bacterium]